MNKTQLIEALSAHFDGNRRQAQHALESVVDTVTREVAKGNKVAITGFGAFERVTRPARMVRNPRTGERTRAKKTNVPKFRAGSDLKAVVSGAKKLPKVAASTAGRAAGTATGVAAGARKAATKKATGSRSTAKKTTAGSRSTAKKSPAKKTSTARKSTAKKAPAKKAPAKKTSTAKKSTAKKTTAKKSTARRTAKKS